MSAAPDRRRAMLARVHIAAKALRLDDDTYGDVLTRVTGSDSARTLTLAQLDAVLAEFRRLGWQEASPAGRRPVSSKAQVRLVYALWRELRPRLRDGSPAALRAFVARQTRSRAHPDGVAAPEFLDSRQLNVVIEALKAWGTRVAQEQAAEAAHVG